MRSGVFVAVVLCLVCMLYAYGAVSDPCAYVRDNLFLFDVSEVSECFEYYQVEQGMVDALLNSLEIIQDIYPYVDIAKNPPENLQRRQEVDYDEEFEKLREALENSNRVIADVFRPTMKFIASFHDGHFGLSVYENQSENLFANVVGQLPFIWDYAPDDTGAFHVYITPQVPNVFLSSEALATIEEKYSNGVYVSTIDDENAIDFLTNLFGEYNDMKSLQGSFLLTLALSITSFPILNYPREEFFAPHTLTYADGTEVEFTFGFTNLAAQTTRDQIVKPKTMKSFVTIDEEMKSLQKAKEGSKMSLRSALTAPASSITCSTVNGKNYISVPTFNEDERLFESKLRSCVSMFDENDKPIVIHLPGNGGGLVHLEMLLFHLLMPNADPRSLVAVRKTETNKQLTMDIGYGALFSNMDRECVQYMYDARGFDKIWKEFETDDLGQDIVHERTKKYFLSYMEYLDVRTKYALKKHIRKPTDIVVVTDGFCFSACSFFVNTVIRTGSAIVAGLGPVFDDDVLFQASQCPSSVVQPDTIFEELEDNAHYGLVFTVTFFESYPISQEMKEKIPGDYEVNRIDKHMEVYQALGTPTADVINGALAVQEEFQTKCNKDNPRLFMVTDECTSDDPHALTVGFACGSDGVWNHSDCRISTCAELYAVDFENNKCVENICDPRFGGADSSAMVYPLYGLIFFVFFALISIIH